MTVAVLLPFLLSTAGTLGKCSTPAFWLSFLQDGFALFACVATLRRTKRYWLSEMATVLTLTSWFRLSFTVLPIGLVLVGTAASIGIGTWSFVVIRKPEVRYRFGSQFDPVDWLGQFVLPRLPAKIKGEPTPSNISRALVLSLSGLCLVGILIGGGLHVHDDRMRALNAEREAKQYQAEMLANKTKQIQEVKEKVQTALTQFNVNKDLAADTLFGAWDHTRHYDEALGEMSQGMTMDQQQKLFQLKAMIQPRIEKKRAETEEIWRQLREDREQREVSTRGSSRTAGGGGGGWGGSKVYDSISEVGPLIMHKSPSEVESVLGHPDDIFLDVGTIAYEKEDKWVYKHKVKNQYLEVTFVSSSPDRADRHVFIVQTIDPY